MEYDLGKFKDKEIDLYITEFDLPVYECWYRMASAYITCSIHLFYSIADNLLEYDFFIGNTSVYLFHHSIELFLKFGISIAGEKFDKVHDLKTLYKKFRLLFSEDEFNFHFDFENIVLDNPEYPWLEETEYPENKQGEKMQTDGFINVKYFLINAYLLRKDFQRLRPLITKKYGE